MSVESKVSKLKFSGEHPELEVIAGQAVGVNVLAELVQEHREQKVLGHLRTVLTSNKELGRKGGPDGLLSSTAAAALTPC